MNNSNLNRRRTIKYLEEEIYTLKESLRSIRKRIRKVRSKIKIKNESNCNSKKLNKLNEIYYKLLTLKEQYEHKLVKITLEYNEKWNNTANRTSRIIKKI